MACVSVLMHFSYYIDERDKFCAEPDPDPGVLNRRSGHELLSQMLIRKTQDGGAYQPLTSWIMEPGGSCCIRKCSPIVPIPNEYYSSC